MAILLLPFLVLLVVLFLGIFGDELNRLAWINRKDALICIATFARRDCSKFRDPSFAAPSAALD